MPLLWLPVEFLHNGLRDDHQCTHLSGIIRLTNLPDMTSPATSGLHLSKLETNGRKCRLRCLWWNFNGAAFCLAQPIGGLLVFIERHHKTFVVNDKTEQYCCRYSLLVTLTSGATVLLLNKCQCFIQIPWNMLTPRANSHTLGLRLK